MRATVRWGVDGGKTLGREEKIRKAGGRGLVRAFHQCSQDQAGTALGTVLGTGRGTELSTALGTMCSTVLGTMLGTGWVLS